MSKTLDPTQQRIKQLAQEIIDDRRRERLVGSMQYVTLNKGRFYVRASVVEAEQLENGRWLVRGSIFRTPTEFSDEDFRASFEQI